MNGSQHYTEGERLLSDASFLGLHGYLVKRDGSLFQPGEHEALIRRALAHFAAAQAAAAALPPVIKMMGDCTEVTAWARAIGADNDRVRPVEDAAYLCEPCEGRNCDECERGGCACVHHRPVEEIKAPF